MNDLCPYIILKASDYRENDVILNGLGPEGRISFLAKGLKKPASRNAAALQLFERSEIAYDRRDNAGLQVVHTARPLNSHRRLREDLTAQVMAQLAAELALRLPDGPDLYEAVNGCFERLDASSEPYTDLSLFLAEMLRREGNEPVTDHCAGCGKTKEIIGISVPAGGLVCRGCFNKAPGQQYALSVLRGFRLVNNAPREHYRDCYGRGANDQRIVAVLLDFFETYEDIRLPGRKFLERMLTNPAK